MRLAGKTHFAVAIDLPGIDESVMSNAPFQKAEIAKLVKDVVNKIGLKDLTIVGHDIGGQIAFSYLCAYPTELKAAIILDVVIPGLPPWDDVIRNPYLWHFAFHSIPKLPEIMVAGREKEYFEYFYTAIAAHPEKIPERTKADYIQSYSSPGSLKTGFNWYRGFGEDAEYNRKIIEQNREITTPVLYMRGEKSGGNMDQYAAGLKTAGIKNLETRVVPDSGHFMVEEQTDKVWKLIYDFIGHLQ